MATGTGPRLDSSHLGKSFRFKGEISGGEDIYIDGQVEGTIQLAGHHVTVGPNAQVQANIEARELLVHGKLKGNAQAKERIEVSRTGSVEGDLAMARIAIQDGAFIQGRVDIRVPGAPAANSAGATASSFAAPAAAGSSPAGAVPVQTPLLDRSV